jgi:hypothetical protein
MLDGSVATGRVSHPGLICDDPLLRSNPIGPPGLVGFGRGADNPTQIKEVLLRNLCKLKPD